jgi:diaminopimelate epimerase
VRQRDALCRHIAWQTRPDRNQRPESSKRRPQDNSATVFLNPPAFDWEFIPLAMPMDTFDMPVGWEDLERPMAVNVGNPHVIFFVPDADAVDLERLGPLIETDPLFPRKNQRQCCDHR